MNIFNKLNTFNTGDLKILKSYMLVGYRNVKNAKISIQISDIPINSEQPIHNHEPEQCYYITRGKGLMTIEKEQAVVKAGDAIFVPSNKRHGIKNMGNEILEYLTANYPAFDENYEKALWPCKP